MKNDTREKKGNNAFFWGLIIGALIATLLTTKRGRHVLRELSELSLDLIENFIEERVTKEKSKPTVVTRDEEIAREDIESEITEDENNEELSKTAEEIEKEFQRYEEPKKSTVEKIESESIESLATATNGHKKKRLFRGIRRK